MTDEQILALYEWAVGNCFRCARRDLDTTLMSRIEPPAGEGYEVRACRACILALEGERRRAAERAGREYVPGRAGKPPA